MLIRDPFDPGSGMEKFGSGIRYKSPGSETLYSLFFFVGGWYSIVPPDDKKMN
jgi:hypothetical protein